MALGWQLAGNGRGGATGVAALWAAAVLLISLWGKPAVADACSGALVAKPILILNPFGMGRPGIDLYTRRFIETVPGGGLRAMLDACPNQQRCKLHDQRAATACESTC